MADDNANTSRATTSAEGVRIQDEVKAPRTIQVKFETQIPDERYHLEDCVYNLPSKSSPGGLRKIVSHLLTLQNADEDEAELSPDLNFSFDFVIDNKLLRSSVGDFCVTYGISLEKVMSIEYFHRTQAPKPDSSAQHPDWVSCLTGLRHSTELWFMSGCYDGVLRCWKPSSSAPVLNVRGHYSPIKDIDLIHSMGHSHIFATAAKDRLVKVWEYDSHNNQLWELASGDGHRLAVESLSGLKQSQFVASGSIDRTIRIWRAPPNLRNPDTNPDEDVSGDLPRKRRRIDTSVGDNENDEDGDVKMEESNATPRSNKRNVHQKRRLRIATTLRGHTDVVKCLHWANPLALYSGSWDHTIRLWDVERKACVYSWLTNDSICAMKYWESQNLILSAHANNKICMWDPRIDSTVETRSAKQTVRSHPLHITSLSVYDGQSSRPLYVSSSFDGSLKFWDLRSHAPLYTLKRHNGKVLCCEWDCATGVVASGSEDCTLKTFSWKF